MPTYRNKTNQDLVVPNVGLVEAGQTIDSPIKIENSNFEEISSQKSSSDEIKVSETSAETTKKEDDK